MILTILVTICEILRDLREKKGIFPQIPQIDAEYTKFQTTIPIIYCKLHRLNYSKFDNIIQI